MRAGLLVLLSLFWLVGGAIAEIALVAATLTDEEAARMVDEEELKSRALEAVCRSLARQQAADGIVVGQVERPRVLDLLVAAELDRAQPERTDGDARAAQRPQLHVVTSSHGNCASGGAGKAPIKGDIICEFDRCLCAWSARLA